jgi:hypothetical protein
MYDEEATKKLKVSRRWTRLMTDSKKVKLPNANNSFGIIREQIIKFKACKI